ncbi:MAG: PAS domain-containing sensor histidine kinase [Puniceicoccaceae bacterium TMED149]|nr:MAG: PAS domain-containing sensor histidine kinase [Puniceicoccaceae bacterium TMED149]
MKASGLDKILGRIEDLDSVNLSILVQRLARERNLQETVFNTIQDGIIVMDSEGVIQYANDTACPLIGLKSSDIGTISLWKMVPDLAHSISPEDGDEGTQKNSVLTREFEINYPEKRFIRLYMVPIDAPVNSEGSGGYVVVLSDITEAQISLEERLENERTSSIMKLAAGVAHELGNPLNSLTIHLELMQRKLEALEKQPKADKIKDSIEICRGEVKRLDAIISNFLVAIRPSKPELNELNLIQLLEEVLQVQEVELADLNIEVKIEIEGDIPSILGDRGQIKQVFFNLIKNAMEAMSDSGQLKIRARSDNEQVYLQFIDNGSGISQTDMPKIFDAYYTTKDSGHGLGMMIVQRILRDHGGQIAVESQSDVGTIITLQFPQQHIRTRMLESGE